MAVSTERLSVLRKHITRPYLNPTNGTLMNRFDEIEFKYTVNNDLLSPVQRQFYEENGYIVIPGLVEHDLLDECSSRFVDLCEGRIPRGGMTLMKDITLAKTGAKGEYLYNKAQDILYDEVFEQYMLHPNILDMVSCFTGPNIKAVHSMLINKPPDSGALTSRHPLHQDLYYFPFRPANRIVAAWTAMERITTENGCLVVIPGTHKGELHQHDYPQWEGGVNKAYHGVKGFDDYELLHLQMEKGDTVFFHPILVHGSGSNKTKGFRKAISCHYAASECYFINVEGTIQQKIADEISEMALKRGLSNPTFQDIWKYRMRLARGVDKTL